MTIWLEEMVRWLVSGYLVSLRFPQATRVKEQKSIFELGFGLLMESFKNCSILFSVGFYEFNAARAKSHAEIGRRFALW